MSTDPLIARIESSAALRRARETLLDEVAFRADPSARFSPMLILMAISIIVQMIAICKERNTEERIVNWIKNARTLPRFRTKLLRRRLDALWETQCGDSPEGHENNALFDAVLDLGETATDAEIKEIMTMASAAAAD